MTDKKKIRPAKEARMWLAAGLTIAVALAVAIAFSAEYDGGLFSILLWVPGIIAANLAMEERRSAHIEKGSDGHRLCRLHVGVGMMLAAALLLSVQTIVRDLVEAFSG